MIIACLLCESFQFLFCSNWIFVQTGFSFQYQLLSFVCVRALFQVLECSFKKTYLFWDCIHLIHVTSANVGHHWQLSHATITFRFRATPPRGFSFFDK